MKKNERGFSAVEILIVLVVVGLIGGAGWYVWQSRNKTNKSSDHSSNSQNESTPETKQSSEAESAKLADETANWKSYSRYGITFKYPNDWGFKAEDSSQSTDTYVTSPDFPGTDESPKAQRITIYDGQYPQSGLTADNFKTMHLDPNPNPYRDYKVLTINGKKAVQFYRGDALSTVFFLANDKTVILLLDTFPDRAASSSVYNKVLETVTIN